MAELGRTVSVSGLPTDIEDDRLSDKLCIHFLRASNGGGDIASVTIVKTTPSSALVTFEDSGVARSVLRHGRQILRVDGKKYELTLREHRRDPEPDQVILSMSVTVDYSQLPQGRTAVTILRRSHPDVQVDYHPPEELCTLRGPYSQVQAAVAQLLGLPGAPQGTADTPSAASNGATRAGGVSPPHSRRSHTQETTTTTTTDRRQRGDERKESLASGPSSSDQGPRGGDPEPAGGRGWEGAGRAEGGAAARPEAEEEEEEDLSLIMDSEMFLYLRRHCAEEYQRILAGRGVGVVDVTAQGVTTLFLQGRGGAGAGAGEGAGREHLKGARRDLSELYQENEARLRKAQLPKSVLSPRGGLQRALEDLRVRLPKLLLGEDDRNVSIIGSSSDVSEAKQFLLLGEREPAAEDIAGPPRSPSPGPDSSTTPGEEGTLAPALPSSSSATGVSDARMDKMLKSYEAERKAEGARGYKLAARFKDSGVGGLGTRPRGSATAGGSSAAPGTRPGLGPTPSREAHLFGSSRAVTQNAAEDILFKNGDPLFAPAVREKTPPLSSVLTGKGLNSPLSSATSQNNPGGSAVPPPGSGSGSGLRRTSSFSGRPRPKAQDPGQSEAAEDSGKATAPRPLARSSSFSNRAGGRDRRGVYTAELTVSSVMWEYVKEAYAARLQDVTSDLQTRDVPSEGSRGGDVTVALAGGESSAVTSCLSELRKLLAAVAADFCVRDLGLAELGVADAADETLEVCCAEIRRRFRKVTIQILRESVFLIGPRQLCSQVGAALREVFSGDAGHRDGREDRPVPSTSGMNQPFPPRSNGASSAALLSQNRGPQLEPDGHKGEGETTGDKNVQRRDSTKRQRKTETELKSGVVGQSSARRDPVIKEKVLLGGGATGTDGSKTDAAASQSANGKGREEAGSPYGVTSGSVSAAHDGRHFASTKDLQSGASQKERGAPRPENREDPRGSLLARRPAPATPGLCVCGESGASLKMTGCGVTLCPRCLVKVHVHCRVCPKAREVRPGIRGNMTYSEVAISLPGHGRDSTVKITYCVPDGVQGEGDPSPGSAFRGGVFEAYLPLCERTHRLLPRLERAFREGLTFTVTDRDTGARVAWDCVPHKTSLQGGKSANGYPDSSYLTRLSEALTALGIEEAPGK